MKTIETNGIQNLMPMIGSNAWYFGCDYATGSVNEYEEAFKNGGSPDADRIVFVHFPEGKVIEPFIAKKGQYLGWPCFCSGIIYSFLVDFIEREIMILSHNTMNGEQAIETCIALDNIRNLRDLFLYPTSPILAEQEDSGSFHIYWPVHISLDISKREVFDMCIDNRLFFTKSNEETASKDEVIVRDLKTGKMIEKIDGRIDIMPDGQIWNIK